jgi:hypothetical protein
MTHFIRIFIFIRLNPIYSILYHHLRELSGPQGLILLVEKGGRNVPQMRCETSIFFLGIYRTGSGSSGVARLFTIAGLPHESYVVCSLCITSLPAAMNDGFHEVNYMTFPTK